MGRFSQRLTQIRTLTRPDDWRRLEPADVLYVCHDADRIFVLDGRRYSPVIDTIQDLLAARGLTGITVATPFSSCASEAAYGQVVTFNRAFATARLGRPNGASAVAIWARILACVRPRGVIAIQPSRALGLAARAAGIWVADAQHGCIAANDDPLQPYYSTRYWSDGGGFPDSFLVWDEGSARNLRTVFAARSIHAVTIGNLWCERFARRDPDDPLVARLPPLVPTGRPRILVTLQWQPPGRSANPARLNDSLPEALQQVIGRTCTRYNWMIRLHPCHSDSHTFDTIRNAVNGHCGGGAEAVSWHPADGVPLPQMLRLADLHLTFNSSSALEASYFNVPTGFLDQNAIQVHARMAHLFEQGLAAIVPAEREPLEDWIAGQLATGRDTRIRLPERAAVAELLTGVLRGAGTSRHAGAHLPADHRRRRQGYRRC